MIVYKDNNSVLNKTSKYHTDTMVTISEPVSPTFHKTSKYYTDMIVPIHLQWFAAEDEGRVFDPSERKIRDARAEGRVAKTQEIPSALILLAVLGVLWGISGYYYKNFSEIFSFYLRQLHIASSININDQLFNLFMFIIRLVLPVMIVAVSVGILGHVVQFGWLVSFKAISPNFSKVSFNLSKWFEKSFSVQGWYTTGISLIKISVISFLVYINIRLKFNEITMAMTQSFSAGIELSIQLIIIVLIESGLVLLALAFIDFGFQRYLFFEQLKMTRYEMKEELKESEGDPQIKNRIRIRMKEFMNKNIPKQVAESDVVVTNPTHFAVAMKYDRTSMDAPEITARGEDEIAFRIRRIAKEEEVPIIENKPLARALYTDLEVGDVIPEKYYRAVVLIFQEVYKMKGVTLDE